MRKMNVYACMLLSAFLGLNGTVTAMAESPSAKENTSAEDYALTNDNQIIGTIQSIDQNTLIIQRGMGGKAMPGAPGQLPDGQQTAPSGKPEDTTGSDAPDKPDDDSSAPDKPDGGSSAPERPDGGSSAPDKPNGDSSAPERPNGGSSAPDKPNGGNMGDAPEMPDDGQSFFETSEVTVTDNTVIEDIDGNEITLSDLESGAYVLIELDKDNNALRISLQNAENGFMGMEPGGAASVPESYDAVTELSEDTEAENETYTSDGTDENAIHILNGASVRLSKITVDRTSADSTGGDTSSFYGVGAAILVTDGNASIKQAEITTDACGGAGIFSYGSGVVSVSDSTITTSQDTSGGIHVAGGGTLTASNLTVETSGESSAAIRSDRGGGTMAVDGGTYTSNGIGSPAVYCTADITIANATLTATNSEAVCIEGLNSLTLTDCILEGDMPENEQNDCIWTVILYQSMSGDSEIGNSSFQMTGGEIISKNGGMFYTTNTESTFYLSDVKLTYSESNDFLLKCTGNSNARGWGQSGANGADCSFTADHQEMAGTIIWDSTSTLDLVLKNESTWTGSFVQDETNADDGMNGYADMEIQEGCTWIVTGDSVLSSLTNHGTILDENGNSVTIQTADGTVILQGDSSFTITADEYREA